MNATLTKVKTGWVLRSTNTKCFACRSMAGEGLFYPGDSNLVSNAHVYNTRREARDEKDGSEVARKVELDDNGKAVKIIPGR